MSKGNVDKFLGLMQKDEGLARKMAACLYKLETNEGKAEGSGDFISREIVPLAKEYGLEFTAQDFLDYTEEAKTKVGLSDDDLAEVSGGKGGVRAALMGTLALVGVASAPVAVKLASGGEVAPFSMVASAAEGDKVDVLKGRANTILSHVLAAQQKGNVEEITAEIQNVEDFLQYLNSLKIDDQELNQKKEELEQKKEKLEQKKEELEQKKEKLEQQKAELKTALNSLQETFGKAVSEGYFEDKNEDQYDEGNDQGEYLAKQAKETLRLDTPILNADDGDWMKINDRVNSVNQLIEKLEAFIEEKKLKIEQDEIKELVENIGNGEVAVEEVADKADKAKLAKQIDIRIKAYEKSIQDDYDVEDEDIFDLEYEVAPDVHNLMRIKAALTNGNVNISQKTFDDFKKYSSEELFRLDDKYSKGLKDYAKQCETKLGLAIENATKDGQSQEKIDKANRLKQELAESLAKIKQKNFDSIVNVLIKVEEAIDSLNKKEEKSVEKKDVKEEPKVEEKKEQPVEATDVILQKEEVDVKGKQPPAPAAPVNVVQEQKDVIVGADIVAPLESQADVKLEEQKEALDKAENGQKADDIVVNQVTVKPDEQVNDVAQGEELGNADDVEKNEKEKSNEGEGKFTIKTEEDFNSLSEKEKSRLSSVNEFYNDIMKISTKPDFIPAALKLVADEITYQKNDSNEVLSFGDDQNKGSNDDDALLSYFESVRTELMKMLAKDLGVSDGNIEQLAQAIIAANGLGGQALTDATDLQTQLNSAKTAEDFKAAATKIDETVEKLKAAVAAVAAEKALNEAKADAQEPMAKLEKAITDANELGGQALTDATNLQKQLNSAKSVKEFNEAVEKIDETVEKLNAEVAAEKVLNEAKADAQEPIAKLAQAITDANELGGQALTGAKNLKTQLDNAKSVEEFNKAVKKIKETVNALNAAVTAEKALNEAKADAQEPMAKLEKAIIAANGLGGQALTDATDLQTQLDTVKSVEKFNEAVEKIDETIQALETAVRQSLGPNMKKKIDNVEEQLREVKAETKTDLETKLEEALSEAKPKYEALAAALEGDDDAKISDALKEAHTQYNAFTSAIKNYLERLKAEVEEALKTEANESRPYLVKIKKALQLDIGGYNAIDEQLKKGELTWIKYIRIDLANIKTVKASYDKLDELKALIEEKKEQLGEDSSIITPAEAQEQQLRKKLNSESYTVGLAAGYAEQAEAEINKVNTAVKLLDKLKEAKNDIAGSEREYILNIKLKRVKEYISGKNDDLKDINEAVEKLLVDINNTTKLNDNYVMGFIKFIGIFGYGSSEKNTTYKEHLKTIKGHLYDYKNSLSDLANLLEGEEELKADLNALKECVGKETSKEDLEIEYAEVGRLYQEILRKLLEQTKKKYEEVGGVISWELWKFDTQKTMFDNKKAFQEEYNKLQEAIVRANIKALQKEVENLLENKQANNERLNGIKAALDIAVRDLTKENEEEALEALGTIREMLDAEKENIRKIKAESKEKKQKEQQEKDKKAAEGLKMAEILSTLQQQRTRLDSLDSDISISTPKRSEADIASVKKATTDLRTRIDNFGEVNSENIIEKYNEIMDIRNAIDDLIDAHNKFMGEHVFFSDSKDKVKTVLTYFKKLRNDKDQLGKIKELEQELNAMKKAPDNSADLFAALTRLSHIKTSIPQIKAMLNKSTTLKKIAEQVDDRFTEIFDKIIKEIEAADSVDKINLAEERLQNAEKTLRGLMRTKINEANKMAHILHEIAKIFGLNQLKGNFLNLIDTLDRFNYVGAPIAELYNVYQDVETVSAAEKDLTEWLGEQIDALVDQANKLKVQADGVDTQLYSDFNEMATNLAADKNELLKDLSRAAQTIANVKTALDKYQGDLMPKLAFKKQIAALKEQATKLKDMATGVNNALAKNFNKFIERLNGLKLTDDLQKITTDFDQVKDLVNERAKELAPQLVEALELDELLENEVMGAEIQDELKAIKAGLPKADEANADTVVKAFDDVKAVKTKMANKLLEWHQILSEYHNKGYHKEGKKDVVEINLNVLAERANQMLNGADGIKLDAETLNDATELAQEIAGNLKTDIADMADAVRGYDGFASTDITAGTQANTLANFLKDKVGNVSDLKFVDKKTRAKLAKDIKHIFDQIKIDQKTGEYYLPGFYNQLGAVNHDDLKLICKAYDVVAGDFGARFEYRLSKDGKGLTLTGHAITLVQALSQVQRLDLLDVSPESREALKKDILEIGAKIKSTPGWIYGQTLSLDGVDQKETKNMQDGLAKILEFYNYLNVQK